MNVINVILIHVFVFIGPTLKLKRGVVAKKFAKEIETLYV